MGRKRHVPTTDGDVVPISATGDGADKKTIDERVMDRLGFDDDICMNCNSRVPRRNSRCRNCGSSQTRRKARKYRNE